MWQGQIWRVKPLTSLRCYLLIFCGISHWPWPTRSWSLRKSTDAELKVLCHTGHKAEKRVVESDSGRVKEKHPTPISLLLLLTEVYTSILKLTKENVLLSPSQSSRFLRSQRVYAPAIPFLILSLSRNSLLLTAFWKSELSIKTCYSSRLLSL